MEIEPDSRDTLLVVCTGNTCRSPMAAVLLRHALDAEGAPLAHYQVESAGTGAFAGDPASENSTAAVKRIGLTLEEHLSQPVSGALIERSALIICMTKNHRSTIRSRFPKDSERVILFREGLDPEEIMDPFGQNFDSYVDCRDSMVEAIPHLIRTIRSRLIPST